MCMYVSQPPGLISAPFRDRRGKGSDVISRIMLHSKLATIHHLLLPLPLGGGALHQPPQGSQYAESLKIVIASPLQFVSAKSEVGLNHDSDGQCIMQRTVEAGVWLPTHLGNSCKPLHLFKAGQSSSWSFPKRLLRRFLNTEPFVHSSKENLPITITESYNYFPKQKAHGHHGSYELSFALSFIWLSDQVFIQSEHDFSINVSTPCYSIRCSQYAKADFKFAAYVYGSECQLSTDNADTDIFTEITLWKC